MINEEFRTLAYNKSPKTSKRTPFQDELQAAVFARADKTKMNEYSDFSEDDDEDDVFLKKLLRSRKKKDAFKAGRNKGKINNFELSDDEDKNKQTKRVSFLKTPRVISPLTAADSNENQQPEHCNVHSSSLSTNVSKDDTQLQARDEGVTSPQTTRENQSKSPSYERSDGTQLDAPLASDSSEMETTAPLVSEGHEKRKSEAFHEEEPQTPQKLTSSTDSVVETEPPIPKPRQRTVTLTDHSVEKLTGDPEPQDLSRPQTSSTSLPVSNETSSTITNVSSSDRATAGSCSPHTPEEDHTVSQDLSKSSSHVRSEQSPSFNKSTVDSGSRDALVSAGGRYSTSFEEYHENMGGHSVHSTDQHVQEKSSDTRTSNSLPKRSQRPRSVSSAPVESKYLGTLKILDRKVSLEESHTQGADSLRAAIYQQWLYKKKEKSKEMKQLRKQEEMLNEKRKREEEAKKEDAVASYVAWKEKKAETLKAKAKEKQEIIQKEQRATEDREEKMKSSKQEFDKWKQQRDNVLREKHRKQREAESKCNLTQQENEEERKRESKSAFTSWYDKKKNVLHEKVRTEREENKYQAEEEQFKREENDKLALEMYENWLVRKELEKKRLREERRIQEILRDSPPPPWSPPNKTIPYRK
ncbi:microtubule-associated protein 9 [Genypterus blacodes]|uniref:microtubule-associated protein 9 n=1 Tax=Genypterus blacodes TaxID=154954 RepID=UPI003F768FE9